MIRILENVKWDGSDLGDIKDYIINRRVVGNVNRIAFWTKNAKNFNKITEARIFKYKDETPLIADELKTLFDITPVGMHKIKIGETEYIMSLATRDVTLDEYFSQVKRSEISPIFVNEMRRLFAFRWLICLNCNFENKVEVRILENFHIPISCNETTFSLDNTSMKCRIPNTILKDWFENDDILLDKCIKELLENRDPNKLKFDIQKIINKYSNAHISWCNSIYERALQNS